MNLSPEILWNIIRVLGYCISGLLGIGAAVFIFFGKSSLKKLDSIDAYMKANSETQGIQIEKTKTLTKTSEDHEERIRQLEKKP